VNRRRRRVVRRLPKLSLAVDAASHLVLAAIASTGAGGDQPYLDGLLFHAWRRSGGRIRCVVADAGYDSEANHRIARQDLGVRSIIPANTGRPSSKPPSEPMRRNMHYRFKRRADAGTYGQRWQSETANSMIKRNLGSAMRARTAVRRRHELLLRVLTHNIMLLAEG
jgi:DDE family transposase